VAAGARLEAVDPSGWTPIFWAEEPATLRALARAGANMNAADPGRRTILHWLVVHDEACVAVALEAGCDPNALDAGGLTPLMYAAEDESRIIPLLFEAGARADLAAPGGVTALHQMAMMGFERGVQLALARPECDPCAVDHAGHTAAEEVGYHMSGSALQPLDVMAQVRAARERRDAVHWADDGGVHGGAVEVLPARRLMRIWASVRWAQLPRVAWSRRRAAVVGCATGAGM
jgi:hypothetical protein